MSQPYWELDEDDEEKLDLKLRRQAGLTKDDDGEWVGTKMSWEEYEKAKSQTLA